MSTIAAISSPIGTGGIGIVRVSGEDALKIANAIFVFKSNNNNWIPLHMHFGTFNADDFSDKGYAVYFPQDKSFTGEDTVEFYLHGGVRIMKGALDALIKNGAVLAQGGEFTKRAFLNGRMTLADAEGVIDMINAESSSALNAAYRLMEGDVSKSINLILDKLETLIATLEATLDYPDEMEDEVIPALPNEIESILNDVNKLLESAKCGKIAKYGINVVLTGKTNAGKSSLMNAMLKTNRAIVTPIAGTTRDTIEDSLEYKGVKINLVDTAGIRVSDDIVEMEGIERAKKAIDGADVILHIIDLENPDEDDAKFDNKLVYNVYNKCDLVDIKSKEKGAFYISAKESKGIDELLDAIVSLYEKTSIGSGEIITSERHVSALYSAQKSLLNANNEINDTLDCILIDLRHAYNSLGEITGKTANEDIVDSIFKKFCVGK